METLNDVGASEFLGVRTLTLSIYSTWINQSNLPGAAQIALVMLASSCCLVVRRARRRGAASASPSGAAHRAAGAPAARRRCAACGASLVGVAPGRCSASSFPALLSRQTRPDQRIDFAGISAAIARRDRATPSTCRGARDRHRHRPRPRASPMRRGSTTAPRPRRSCAPPSLGYALPGTVLALGLLAPLAGLDNFVDGLAADASASRPACSSPARAPRSPMPMSPASSRSRPAASRPGLAKIPRSLDHSARTLGETATGAFRRVHLPLIRPALGAAAILVFVDCMKELPATLLLRPLNFETLATHLYGEAARGTYEDGAVAALAHRAGRPPAGHPAGALQPRRRFRGRA